MFEALARTLTQSSAFWQNCSVLKKLWQKLPHPICNEAIESDGTGTVSLVQCSPLQLCALSRSRTDMTYAQHLTQVGRIR